MTLRVPVPYYSQRLTQDNYCKEGFPSLDEALEWTDRICGLACLKMALAHYCNREVPLYRLLQQGLDLNAYLPGKGWIHQGLVDIANTYGLYGLSLRMEGRLELLKIALEQGALVVASVSPGFNPARRGGHLVVITGVSEQQVTIHHPSSRESCQWADHSISLHLFSKSCSVAGNIILFSDQPLVWHQK